MKDIEKKKQKANGDDEWEEQNKNQASVCNHSRVDSEYVLCWWMNMPNL